MNHLMRSFLVFILCVLMSCTSDETLLSVEIGPTQIPRGDATAANDITVSNALFAVAFAVDTAPPWGVARGGIVDISIIRNGELDYDIASLADFMPNNWSSWPTTYQRVTVETQTHEEVVIRTERDWGDVELVTRFHIKARDSRIRIVTSMTNKGDAAIANLLSGYVVWPDGGNLIEAAVVSGKVDSGQPESNGWTAAYDAGWVIGLMRHFPRWSIVVAVIATPHMSLARARHKCLRHGCKSRMKGRLRPCLNRKLNSVSSHRANWPVASLPPMGKL
jgi:hypothetical protein